ncbi:MAG: Gfo/Idh/MocA family oxidoreductase [Thermoguttaceae bacterium]|nr:Gfo/Idh/MocA family oxidoreductase [Thermoguttaceae bacterium]
MKRIGIIGVGKIARTYFKVLRLMKNDVQVAFLCDIVPEQMTSAEREFPDVLAGVGQFRTSDEALDVVGKVDAVIIATPVNTHCFLARAVLKRGVPTYVEKPGVEKMEELAELYDLAGQYQTHFQTLFHYAYAPEVERFTALRSEIFRNFGPVRGFACDFQDPVVIPGEKIGKNPGENRLIASPRKAGGSWLSSGVNALSVVFRTLNPLWEEIRSLRMVSHAENQVPNLIDRNEERVLPAVDTSSVTEYAAPGCGFSGIIRTDWVQNWNFKSTLFSFQNGTILIDHTAQSLILTRYDVSETPIVIPCGNEIPGAERQYFIMFRRHLFEPEDPRDVKEMDFQVHKLLFAQS